MPGVGYPNPNRSHFERMAIWHTARTDPEEHKGYGWLGRALDAGRRATRTRSATTSRGPPRPAQRGHRADPARRPALADAGTVEERGRPGGAAGPARVRPPAGGRRDHRGRQDGRRWPRRPTGPATRQRPGRAAEAGRPAAEGRPRHAGLLHRPGRLRHARHAAVHATRTCSSSSPGRWPRSSPTCERPSWPTA